MAPRRTCLVCGSKQWHKEPISGSITCSEGHVLQNYRTEARILDEFGPHAMKKRALKSGRTKKERPSKADPQLYHGNRARYHYFQCLQLILRYQIKALIELWKLPNEYEVVCRDIWALHLSLFSSPLPAEPLLFRNDREHDTIQSGGSDSSSSSSSSDDEDKFDSDMEALLQEISEPSSSENEDQPAKPPPVKAAHRRREYGTYSFPSNNIAVLMLGCWTLRIPIIYSDFTRAIECYDLPYIDALTLIPLEMRRHLTKHNVRALSPHFSPTTILLHTLASRLAKRIYSTYGIFTPEVNAAPILWRAVRRLCGNATIYSVTKKLAGIISLPLTLHHSLAPVIQTPRRNDPETHKFDNVPPEVALIAAVVVILRLVYGLDGKKRFPRNPNDPAYALPTLSEYIALLQKVNEAESKERHQVFSPNIPMPVHELDEDTLDHYLDFCAEKALPSRRDSDPIVEEYFPLSQAQRQVPLQTNVSHPQTEAFSLAMPTSTDENDLSPGEKYRIYHSDDILGHVPEEYQLVVGRAARWTGVDEEYMYSVVEKFERRFLRWWKAKKKREREIEQQTAAEASDLGGDE